MHRPLRHSAQVPSIHSCCRKYRTQVVLSDLVAVERIVLSSGFFSRAEVGLARELVDERLRMGVKSGYDFLFLELDGQVEGYACFGPIPCTRGAYDLYWIAVHDAFRGLGLGREILAGAEDIMAAMGGKRVYVETSARPQYEPTRIFYRACGYREEAVLKDFYAESEDKVVYLKVFTVAGPVSKSK